MCFLHSLMISWLTSYASVDSCHDHNHIIAGASNQSGRIGTLVQDWVTVPVRRPLLSQILNRNCEPRTKGPPLSSHKRVYSVRDQNFH